LKASEVTDVSPPLDAVRVYPLPARSRVRSAKVATPFTAAAVRVPPSVAPPGLFPRATATSAVLFVTTLP
jgi:hypothetical protein